MDYLLNNPGRKQINRFNDLKLFDQICKFIKLNPPEGRCIDISVPNPKINYIKNYFGVKIEQFDTTYIDLNFFNKKIGKFDYIFFFETLEDLQNPLNCMIWLKSILNGTIYLSTPRRIKLLWQPNHYNEIPLDRLKGWILKPLNLDIVRMHRLRPTHHWSFYLKGFRPFLRLFLNYSWMYEIKKS